MTSPDREHTQALPTTGDAEIVDVPMRSALRACRYRLEEMRTAVIAARALCKMIKTPEGDPLGEATHQWVRKFGALADPPLEVEVEEDDDPDGTPVEGAWSVTESETDERRTPEARRERALWTRDLAQILREQTAVDPELLPGLKYAADFLDGKP